MAKVYDNATDLITFARLQSQNTTSGSSYLGSDGLLKFAAEDEPRIEYGSDGSLKGLLIEEQRANLITYSEDFSQWHNFSGETSAALSSDTIYGVSAYEITGSTGGFGLGRLAANGGGTINLTSAGVLTFWAKKVVTGSSLQYLWNGSIMSFDAQVPNDGEWHKVEISLPAATAVLQLLRGFTSGTVAVAGAQLEEGSFATSYIPTSGSQQTRSADVASIPVSAFGYNQTAGTVVVEVDSIKAGVSQRLLSINNSANTSGERTDLLNNAGSQNVQHFTVDGGTTQTDHSLSVAGLTSFKIAATIAPDDYSMCVNGGTVVAETDGTPTVPTVDTFRLGGGVSSPLNGHIKSLKYYPRRLTDAQLQELTS